jgi:hypothetical protein
LALYYLECFEPRPGCGPDDVRRVVGASADAWLERNPTDERILIAGKVLGLGHGFPAYFSIWKIKSFDHLDHWIGRFVDPDIAASSELAAWGSAAVERSAAVFADMGEELPAWGLR